MPLVVVGAPSSIKLMCWRVLDVHLLLFAMETVKCVVCHDRNAQFHGVWTQCKPLLLTVPQNSYDAKTVSSFLPVPTSGFLGNGEIGKVGWVGRQELRPLNKGRTFWWLCHDDPACMLLYLVAMRWSYAAHACMSHRWDMPYVEALSTLLIKADT